MDVQEQVKKGFEGVEAKLRAEMEAKLGAELDARIEAALKKASPEADLKTIREDVQKVKAALGRQGGAQPVELKSIGAAVVRAVEEQRDKVKSGGKIEVKGEFNLFAKGLETTSSDVIRPKWYRDGDVEIIRWTPRLRDYMVVIPVSSGDIRYTRDTAIYELYTEVATAAVTTDTALVVDNAAGFFVGQSISIRTSTVQVRTVSAVNKTTNTLTLSVALSADVAVDVAVTSEVFSFTSEAQTKPQGKFKQEEVSLSLKTIATGISPSKEILDDKPRLEATINARLPAAIARSEEYQILRGDGSTDQITGIFATSGISTRTQGVPDTKADTIRKAISDVRVNGQMAADLILIRPEDLALIELAKDSTGQYVETLQMMPDGSTMLWRTRVIECDSLATNTCLVGAFGEGAELYERGEVEVDIFPQHSNYAERNLVYIRAERRIALGVLRASAFCAVTFT